MQSNKSFNGERLKAARIYRNKTITELAEVAGVTKQAISQFENGKATPSFETLLRITSALEFPKEYFYETDKADINIGTTYFRALLTVNKKDRLSQIEKTKTVAKLYHFLEGYIEFPQLNLPSFDSYNDMEQFASQVRKYWGLGNEPITNMVRLLEKNGLIITSFSTDGKGIDAFSQRQQINGTDHFFIVLGDDKNSATRRQFDAAHELGHILLHDWSVDLELLSREEFRQQESEANQFAAAFLLPKEAFIADLLYPRTLEFYVELKKKWKTSITAMIIRAYQLKAINNNQYQYLMRQVSKNGWRAKEPLDNIIQVSKPTVLKRAIEMLIGNEILSGAKILQQMSSYGLTLPRKEVELLLGLDEGTLLNKEQICPVIGIKNWSGNDNAK